MLKVRSLIVCLFIVSLTTAPSFAADPVRTTGKVDAVTVYRGQALVSRAISAPDAQGLTEIVVTGLPSAVIPGSIYAEASDDTEVRSVRYIARPVSKDIREEVRDIDAKLETLGDQMADVQSQLQLQNQKKQYIDRLENFVAGTGQVESQKGVLDPATLTKMTEYIFEKRETLRAADLELTRQQRDLQEQSNLLRRERNVITGSSSKVEREAIVFVNAKGNGANITLRYLVYNASWSPSYNVRAESAAESLTIEYLASVQQQSGEDWGEVNMTLSTATPAMVATAPSLDPLTIKLSFDQKEKSALLSPDQYKLQWAQLQEQQRSLERSRNNLAPQLQQQLAEAPASGANAAPSVGGGRGQGPAGPGGFVDREFFADGVAGDYGLNENAAELQNFEIANGRVFGKDAKKARPTFDEGIAVTYRLDGRTSLPSRSDHQLIQIASMPMKGDFYRKAAPVLTQYIYREAAVINSSELVLLAGPASTYIGGEFVGHGVIPTIAAGEKFTIGLGIDSSLRAGRELISREEKIQGGNKVVEFQYKLAVDNFSSQPASIRLFDRLPQADDKQVRIVLGEEAESKLSDDENYLQSDRKKGILRFDLDLAGKTNGVNTTEFIYTFTLEYDKQLRVDGLAANQP